MINFDKILSISESLNDHHISYAQFFILCKLSTTESLSVPEIESTLAQTRPATVGIIDRLAKLKLVARRHFTDSETIAVVITDSGLELVQKLNDELDKYPPS